MWDAEEQPLAHTQLSNYTRPSCITVIQCTHGTASLTYTYKHKMRWKFSILIFVRCLFGSSQQIIINISSYFLFFFCSSWCLLASLWIQFGHIECIHENLPSLQLPWRALHCTNIFYCSCCCIRTHSIRYCKIVCSHINNYYYNDGRIGPAAAVQKTQQITLGARTDGRMNG